MNSADTSHLWSETDLTCKRGARNLPAVPMHSVWMGPVGHRQMGQGPPMAPWVPYSAPCGDPAVQLRHGPLLTTVRNRDEKGRNKGKMMSQKLLEGQRENQQCVVGREPPRVFRAALASTAHCTEDTTPHPSGGCTFAPSGCSALLLFGLC